MTALIKHGMLLQSAHGPLPNVAEMIAGEPIRGNWWNHPASHSIFDALNLLAASPDVVRMRLVNGKLTLVHRRLWPALVRIADRFPAENLAAIHEEHTASGAHRVRTEAFPDWVPHEVLHAAQALSVQDALTELPEHLRLADQGEPCAREPVLQGIAEPFERLDTHELPIRIVQACVRMEVFLHRSPARLPIGLDPHREHVAHELAGIRHDFPRGEWSPSGSAAPCPRRA